MEYRRKCKVCGKIYCYSEQEVSENNKNAVLGTINAIGRIGAAVGGSKIDNVILNQQANMFKTKDFNKCPFCNSSDTYSISDDEMQNLTMKGLKIEISGNASIESLLKRIEMFLEEENWIYANAYCEHILDISPDYGMVYVYKLMIDLKIGNIEDLSKYKEDYTNNKNYLNALRYADEKLKYKLQEYSNACLNNIKECEYISALEKKEKATSSSDYKDAADAFCKLGTYKDSDQQKKECLALQISQANKEEENLIKEKEKQTKIKKEKKARQIKIIIGILVIVISCFAYQSITKSIIRNKFEGNKYTKDERNSMEFVDGKIREISYDDERIIDYKIIGVFPVYDLYIQDYDTSIRLGEKRYDSYSIINLNGKEILVNSRWKDDDYFYYYLDK